MAAMTTVTNAASLHLYYEKKMLSVLEPRLVFHPLGVKQRLPKGLGKQVKWLRYSKVASSTVALTEATVPSEISITTSNVTKDVSQYGQWVKISDRLKDTAIDNVMKNSVTRLGKAASETIEDLIVAELDTECALVTGAEQFVNNRADDGTVVAGDDLSHLELIEARIAQEMAYIGPHESGFYVAVINPASKFDMLSDTSAGSFLDINKYVGQGRKFLMNGEFGEMYGIKLLVSDKCTNALGAGGGGIDVHYSYMIGEEAFGVVSLDGKNIELISKPHGSAGSADPLNQFASVGYKINGFGCKFLASAATADEKRVIRIHASTAM